MTVSSVKPPEEFSFQAWEKSIKNFDWLKKAVTGAMDIDFFTEWKGQFCVIEEKPWTNGIVLPYGQHKALYALSQLGVFRVYLVGAGEQWLHVARFDTSPPPVVRRGRPVVAWWPPDRFTATTREGLEKVVGGWRKGVEEGLNN